MVEVFKTNVECKEVANELINILQKTIPHILINFDLEDCDKILRIKAKQLDPYQIIYLVHQQGYQCKILE